MRTDFRSLLLAMALAAGGCGGPDAPEGDRVTSENQALEVGNAFLESQNPGRPREWSSIGVVDMGNRWRLSYNHGGTGGPFIVVVNKRSGEVVHFETEQ